jgi:hypothetical protein
MVAFIINQEAAWFKSFLLPELAAFLYSNITFHIFFFWNSFPWQGESFHRKRRLVEIVKATLHACRPNNAVCSLCSSVAHPAT